MCVFVWPVLQRCCPWCWTEARPLPHRWLQLYCCVHVEDSGVKRCWRCKWKTGPGSGCDWTPKMSEIVQCSRKLLLFVQKMCWRIESGNKNSNSLYSDSIILTINVFTMDWFMDFMEKERKKACCKSPRWHLHIACSVSQAVNPKIFSVLSH